MSVFCDLWLHFRLILFLLRPDGGARLRITFLLAIASLCVWCMGIWCYYDSHSLLYSLQLILNNNPNHFPFVFKWRYVTLTVVPLLMVLRTLTFHILLIQTDSYKWNTFDVIQPALNCSNRLQINIKYQHILRRNRTKRYCDSIHFLHCWTVRVFFLFVYDNTKYNVQSVFSIQSHLHYQRKPRVQCSKRFSISSIVHMRYRRHSEIFDSFAQHTNIVHLSNLQRGHWHCKHRKLWTVGSVSTDNFFSSRPWNITFYHNLYVLFEIAHVISVCSFIWALIIIIYQFDESIGFWRKNAPKKIFFI